MPLVTQDARRLVEYLNVPVCKDYDRSNDEPPRLDAVDGIWLVAKTSESSSKIQVAWLCRLTGSPFRSCEPLVMELGDVGFKFCKISRHEYDPDSCWNAEERSENHGNGAA